jgi:hypothetical protein
MCDKAECEPESKEEPKAEMEKCGEMSKSEPKASEADLKKSEETAALLKNEIESIKKENEELKKSVDGLVSAINSYVTKAPARKAITDIEFVKKSEEVVSEKSMTKSEITKILGEKTKNPTLSKADRDAINDFYMNNAGLEKIKHLLNQ